jgi:hypothetical protein
MKLKINELVLNKSNPRIIRDEKFKKLVKSIKEFPEMLELRPIVIDEDNVILGGNMRYRACKEAGLKEVPVKKTENLTEEQKNEFIVKDNASYGEWDWDILANEWEINDLEDWTISVPIKKNTEVLSDLQYESIYYEPKKKPDVNLIDCIDLTKFNEKLEALNEYKISDKQKETLKWFAYRFIKIDFENVANYYFFNADDEEQKAIERLRLVLSDNSMEGFIEDDLLKILNKFQIND